MISAESKTEVFVRRMLTPTDKAFPELWAIYSEGIPVGEAKTLSEFEALIKRPDYSVLVFEHKCGGEVLAFTMMYLGVQQGFALLEYMAVAKGLRSAGVGSFAFQTAISEEHVPALCEVILVEVDSPAEHGAADTPVRKRRVEFYRRNGCLQIANLSYLLPLKTTSQIPSMDLLIHMRNRERTIAKQELHMWLTSIFVHVYECESDDKRINTMLQSQGNILELV